MYEPLGFLAGIISLIGFLPQAIKTLRTRQTADLSLVTFTLVSFSAVLWVIYGLANQRPAIWVTNIVVAICNLSIAYVMLLNYLKQRN
jgi:MtN3 and saliva related transmembrane protein